MFILLMTLTLSNQPTVHGAIDNIQFKTMNQCEVYKKRMKYRDTKSFTFTCKRA